MRMRYATKISSGSMIRLTSASIGDRKNMTTRESTIRMTLPLMIGSMFRSPCTSAESEFARETSWPVDMRSRLAKSIDCR
jgi:hypothetical protein